jgi:hypothetical protein
MTIFPAGGLAQKQSLVSICADTYKLRHTASVFRLTFLLNS